MSLSCRNTRDTRGTTMSKNLFISALEPKSGISLITLGVMEFLARNLGRVAIFRPIINTRQIQGNYRDELLHLIYNHHNLDQTYDTMFAYTFEEARTLVSEKKYDKLLEGVLDKYKDLESQYDFILCIGTDYESDTSAFEFDLNVAIANNLGSPVLMLARAHGSISEVVKACEFATESFEEKGAQIISIIINRTPVDPEGEILKELRRKLQDKVDLLYSIPLDETLDRPTMEEIAQTLQPDYIFGEAYLNRPITKSVVAAMFLRTVLPLLESDSLVITPLDRIDIILGTLAAYRSKNMPNIGGLVATGCHNDDELLRNIIQGMETHVPILLVKEDTFTAAMRIKELHTILTPQAYPKISSALGLFETNVNTTELRERIIGYSAIHITPKMFEFGLIKRARDHKQTIVLPEGEEERIMRAAEILVNRDAVNIILLGNAKKIREKLNNLGIHLGETQIIDPVESEYFEDYVESYFQARKHKGITPDNAKDVMSSVNYFGTMMVHKGHADGMVSGAVHSTLNTVRPSLEFVKTKPGSTIMSSVFFMCLEDRVLVYGDCAVNPRPNAAQLAEIAVTSAETALLFGVKPLVAMLSYSSGSSGIGEEVDKIKEATRLAKERAPHLLIEGPIQYDAAVDPVVAKAKMPESKVAGKATIFIFPDLNTGNNTYKAVQRSADAVAIGPVMQGLNKPVNDLSRGCLIPDIVNTVAITAIQAQAKKGLL